MIYTYILLYTILCVCFPSLHFLIGKLSHNNDQQMPKKGVNDRPEQALLVSWHSIKAVCVFSKSICLYPQVSFLMRRRTPGHVSFR